MRPLLLVHGIVSNARQTFGAPGRFFKGSKPDSMFGFLVNQGYQPGKTLFWYSYPTLAPIFQSARRLQLEIARVQDVSGCRELDLLTFSLGGIIGKYCVISPMYRGEISKMIMIAPPFWGSPRANAFRTHFDKSGKDFLFPGDCRALSPQILGSNHPLLRKLARHPFPDDLKTVIIAMKIVAGANGKEFTRLQRFITARIGEGDMTVPLVSTKIAVNQHYVVSENFSRRAVHGFLPTHPRVQGIVLKELLN